MESARPEPRLRVVQTLLMALAMGMVMFGCTVAYLVKSGAMSVNVQAAPEMLKYVAKGMFAAGVLLGWVLWKHSCRTARSRAAGTPVGEAGEVLFPIFQSGLIVRGALLEAPGLFCITLAMITGDLWMLAWGAMAVAGLIAIFPVQANYDRFVRDAVGAESP